MRITTSPDAFGVDLDTINLFDPALYQEGDPHPIWKALRDRAPVHWQQLPDGRGFWSITRYHDAALVLRDHERFTSERGNLLYTLGRVDPAAGKMMTSMDPPRHDYIREPLAKALSQKELAKHEDGVRGAVRCFLAPLVDEQPYDMAAAALLLPMAIIGPLLGIPEQDWLRLARATTGAVAPDDAKFQEGDAELTLASAHYELFEYFSDLVRGADSTGLIDVLRGIEIDGKPLELDEVVYNCYSVLLGANVTAPHVITGTLLALIERPESYAQLAERSAAASAVEEGLRWSSPANHFMRYAVADVELHGARIRAGDPLAVWMGSANRDEEVFNRPYHFDIDRRPNRHLAFGFGRHYCVGAPMARLALNIVFTEITRLVERWELAGPVEHMRSNFVAGITRLPVTATLRPGAAELLQQVRAG
ncbi:MAG: cytochrome P450 [Pseudonocardiaceae bacterium]